MSVMLFATDSVRDILADALGAGGVEVVGDGAETAVILVASAVSALALAETGEDAWVEACETPLRDARRALQAARSTIPKGGRIVFVTSTDGLHGVPGHVGACAVAEGVRALAKSAAAAWSADGTRVNVASVARDALESPESLRAVVAPVIAMLLAAPPELNAATVIVDGGKAMMP